jgi:excisionase family DNA binding protein
MEELMTIVEVAKFTKLKVPTLRKYVAKESIPFQRLGSAIRFKPSEIQAWVDSRSHGSAAVAAAADDATGREA